MFLDKLTLLCDAQAFDADAVSLWSYDLGNVTPKRDPAVGEPLGIGISVDVAADFTSGTETYQFELIQSATEDLGSPTVLMAIPLTAAQLTVGAIVILPIPMNRITQRFIGLNHNGTSTTPTVTITAWIAPLSMLSIAPAKSYAKGYAQL